MAMTIARFLKWIGWRCIRWADRLDGTPPKMAEGAFPVKDYDYGLSPEKKKIIESAVKTVLARKREPAGL